MLRTITRNGAVNGTFSSGRLGNGVLLTTLSRGDYHKRVGTLALVRLASTDVSPSTARAESREPPPNAAGALRKPRADFKPGPLKPPSKTSQLASDKKTVIHPHKGAQVTRSVGGQAEAVADEPKPSVLELAKRDIAEAMEQGVLAPLPPDAGRVTQWIHPVKELFKFYWNGLKAINTHRKQVSAIRDRMERGGPLPSRAEMRFMKTYNQDALKLIPFIIIVFIAEEIIPFIALYAPRMLPSTCVLPGQQNRIVFKRHSAQANALTENRGLFENMRKAGEQAGFTPSAAVTNFTAISSSLGLPSWGPSLLSRWRVSNHLTYITADDKILAKEGYGQNLTQLELRDALHERGVPFNDKDKDDMQHRLKWWLDTADSTDKGDPISRRIFALALANSRA
ncbi:hypothetical protein CONPUDRAFT_136344 [Coniophora puteana RWD-64-598 SS2]|uniref:Letm1 RBD domain-containing protein n=1 Tax=Coniophora puteana (strain RWD-64-598) TaxID=741705 RepID=A0A5M3MVQ3_CONPW|nr:uncharacterized protein CONPUDRAFT_136344 [Coniophora puteana RWD-64-598 SS2]EIW83242.1 hypothetical protein CONPUDRAFT_136344 [Coniophora puteana RWD-64-598 SS2]